MVRYSELFLLSETGSNHATAYCEFNKSLTLDGKTHALWYDDVATTVGSTYDHAAGAWSAPVTLGEGADNHNTPTLTADAEGRLHLAYGPHGVWGRYPDGWPNGAFKYAIADEPNSLAGLEKCVNGIYPVGYRATYGCLLHVPPGVDCLVYRGGEHPHKAMFQRRTAHGGWTNARALTIQDIAPQYTHVGAQITADRDGVLYFAAHYYAQERGDNLGVVALKSTDLGDSWTDLAGHPVATPARWHEEIAVPPGAGATVKGISLDSRGALHVLTTGGGVLLSRWEDGWRTIDMKPFLPEGRHTAGGTMIVDARDRIHVVLNMVLAGNRGWADPSNEIFHLVSMDGGQRFECHQISVTNPDEPSWLPNISRGGPYHPVEKPLILFMQGNTSHACKVYGIFVEDVA